MRGYWWSPDGGVAAGRAGRRRARSPAGTSPTRPTPSGSPRSSPTRRRHAERAGLAGRRRARRRPVDVRWDTAGTSTSRTSGGRRTELLIVVQPRDQRALRVLRVDPATGATALVLEDTDPHWVEIVPGVPGRTASGALLWITDDGPRVGWSSTASPSPAVAAGPRGARRRRRHGAVQRLGRPGLDRALDLVRGGGLLPHPGARGCTAGGCPAARSSCARQSLDADGTVTTVRGAGATERTIASLAGTARGSSPRITLHAAGERALRTALLLPSWHRPGHRCRCSWTPTAGRTPSASSPPAGPT